MARKWYQKATVQAAMVAGVLALVAAVVGPSIKSAVEPLEGTSPAGVLLPPQERLLELLAKYQERFGASKLVISRSNGTLYFDDDPRRGAGVSLLKDLYGSVDAHRAGRFEELVESMPAEYVRVIAESRFDNPFVLRVTGAGIKHLRGKR